MNHEFRFTNIRDDYGFPMIHNWLCYQLAGDARLQAELDEQHGLHDLASAAASESRKWLSRVVR